VELRVAQKILHLEQSSPKNENFFKAFQSCCYYLLEKDALQNGQCRETLANDNSIIILEGYST